MTHYPYRAESGKKLSCYPLRYGFINFIHWQSHKWITNLTPHQAKPHRQLTFLAQNQLNTRLPRMYCASCSSDNTFCFSPSPQHIANLEYPDYIFHQWSGLYLAATKHCYDAIQTNLKWYKVFFDLARPFESAYWTNLQKELKKLNMWIFSKTEKASSAKTWTVIFLLMLFRILHMLTRWRRWYFRAFHPEGV